MITSRSQTRTQHLPPALPKLIIHPDSMWKLIRAAGTDSHGNRMSLCECGCPEHTRRQVRNADLKSGSSMGCGCERSRQLWQANKRIKNPVVVSSNSESAAQQAENKTDTIPPPRCENNTLIVDGVHAPPSEPVLCMHAVGLCDNIRLGTSSLCYACRNIWTTIDALRELERVDHEDPAMSMARGMAPEGGKNFITGGHGWSGLEFKDQRRQMIERYGGKRRSAAGRDKIAPWQAPKLESEIDGDEADTLPDDHVEKDQGAAEQAARHKKLKPGRTTRMPKEYKGRNKDQGWIRFRSKLKDLPPGTSAPTFQII